VTEEQYNALTEKADAIADAVTARIESGFSWKLTPAEIRVLKDAPGIAEADAILAKYTPSGLDVRREMVLKGIALAMLALPDIARAVNLGWDGGADA